MLKEGEYHTSIITSLLLVGIAPTQCKEIEFALRQVVDIQFEVATFISLDTATNFLEEEPHFTTVLLNVSSFIKDNNNSTKFRKKFPNISVIVLSKEADIQKGQLALQLGAQDFIPENELTPQRLSTAILLAEHRMGIQKVASQDIIKSQERFQDIINNSKDAIYICNLEGKLIDFNKATANLLDYTYQQLLSVDIHNLMHSSKRRNEFLVRLVAAKKIENFEVEIERQNGERRQCVINARIMENTDFTGYSGIIRDITEQKQAASLKKARDIAQQSAQLKEQFIASISHEMRTPMNAILGMSNLVIKTDLNEEQYNYISSIKQSSEILLGVVNDILQISEIQNGKVKFENKDFDLHALLQNLIKVMQYKTKEKNLDLQLNMDKEIPQIIRGDKLRLNQILYNLVGNAIKFTDTGHVKISIINLSQNSYSVQIKFIVEDTGIGIPQEKADAIFESFTRIRTKDRIFEGTGLGLSIAKNLVEQQGGKIGVTSKINIGSNFFFDLIFEVGNELVDPTENTIELIPPDSSINLLLVEDHKMNQLVAKKTLEKQWKNIRITIANNGVEAIAILEKEVFDIILMDIQMPKMNGYETTQYIQQKMPPKIAKIPILAMTAHAHISQNGKFKEYGMDDFVLKPFEPVQLFQKISQYALKNIQS